VDELYQFLQTLPGVLIILFIGVGWLLTAVVSSWAKHWREVKVAEAEAGLKTKMIERGMKADEIERVLRSEKSSKKVDEVVAATRARQKESPLYAMIESGTTAEGIVRVIEAGLPVKESAADVASWMAENGYEGEDVALVVAAMKRTVTPVTA
jgi:Na+-translocating ferredoxin:NAD+ oxidoreductase RnfG subunit